MTRLRVAFAGPHVTFQDSGRLCRMRYGVPASGPMDRKAFAIAQSVFGNPWSVAALSCKSALDAWALGLCIPCTKASVW